MYKVMDSTNFENYRAVDYATKEKAEKAALALVEAYKLSTVFQWSVQVVEVVHDYNSYLDCDLCRGST